MSGSGSTPATSFGAAVFWCVRFWNCCVKAPPQASLNPVKAAPASFGDSNTLRPRWSAARMYWISIGGAM